MNTTAAKSPKLSPTMEEALVYMGRGAYRLHLEPEARTLKALERRGMIEWAETATVCETTDSGSYYVHNILNLWDITPAGWAWLKAEYGMDRPADEGRLTVGEALDDVMITGNGAMVAESEVQACLVSSARYGKGLLAGDYSDISQELVFRGFARWETTRDSAVVVLTDAAYDWAGVARPEQTPVNEIPASGVSVRSGRLPMDEALAVADLARRTGLDIDGHDVPLSWTQTVVGLPDWPAPAADLTLPGTRVRIQSGANTQHTGQTGTVQEDNRGTVTKADHPNFGLAYVTVALDATGRTPWISNSRQFVTDLEPEYPETADCGR